MESTTLSPLAQYPFLTLDFSEEIFESLQKAEIPRSAVIDLSSIRQIDTAGAQLLLALSKTADISFCNCPDVVLDFVKNSGLAAHFPIHEEAVS